MTYLLTYGFPCQDISLAGQQKGFVDEDGNITRSGLFFNAADVIRHTQPKFAIFENVKNLISKKFKNEFDAVLTTLDELGYNTYWKVLNSKNFGIPQNRERVFGISIRKDIDKGFEFPEEIPLMLRLKDMLEDNVDEKYYLKGLKNYFIKHSFESEEKGNGFRFEPHVQNNATIGKTITTNAGSRMDDNFIIDNVDSDKATFKFDSSNKPLIKDIKIQQVGNIVSTGNWDNPQRGRIYSAEGLSPSLNTVGGGGLEPKIIEPHITIPENTKKGYKEAYDGDGIYINRPHQKRGCVQHEMIPTLKTSCGNDLGVVVEDKESFIEKKYNSFIENEGYVPEMFNPYNCKEIIDVAPTQTANCGVVTSSAAILKVEDFIKENNKNAKPQPDLLQHENGICRCIPAGTHSSTPHLLKTVVEEQPTIIGSTQKNASVRKDGISPTLTASMGMGGGHVPMVCNDDAIIKKQDIVFPVRVRKYPVDCKTLYSCLRSYKGTFTNKEIATRLGVPLTKVEHWFRNDDSFAIPDENIWFELKDLLGIETTEFDKSIMTFETKDNVFEKANRCYEVDGIAPTLTATNAAEKIIEGTSYGRNFGSKGKIQDENGVCNTLVAAMGTGGGNVPIIPTNDLVDVGKTTSNDTETISRLRIRKLTPRECWRLMGFADKYFDRVEGVSNTQLYKQAGNSIVVDVLRAIFRCFKEQYPEYFRDIWEDDL